MAHADETDDSHQPGASHPGCVVVPAALAMAEKHGRSGADLLRAIRAEYPEAPLVGLGAPEDAWRGAAPLHAVGAGEEAIRTFEEEERDILVRALELTGWNVKRAAERLKLGRATLYRKIDRYGLRRAS